MTTPQTEEIKFQFSSSLPGDLKEAPILISGSVTGSGRSFLLQVECGTLTKAFEIRHTYRCSPHNEASVDRNLLAVGYEGFIFLYDLTSQKNLLAREVGGYFSHLYWHEGDLFVTGACLASRIDRCGKVV